MYLFDIIVWGNGYIKEDCGYQSQRRLHFPYIVWIPQVPVLSVEHEDKRNLISNGAIFTAIRQDPYALKWSRVHFSLGFCVCFWL